MPPFKPPHQRFPTCSMHAGHEFYRTRLIAAERSLETMEAFEHCEAICKRLLADPDCPLAYRAEFHSLLAIVLPPEYGGLEHADCAVGAYEKLLEEDPKSKAKKRFLMQAKVMLGGVLIEMDGEDSADDWGGE